MVHVQEMLESLDGIALILDPQRRVVAGGWGNWERFWSANGGNGPAPQVLGQDLTQAIAGDMLRSAFRAAMTAVALGERPALRLDFRCDAPRLRRDVRLTVARCGTRHLLYHSIVLAETPLLRPLPRRPAPHVPTVAPACSLCGATPPEGADSLDWAAAELPRPPAGQPPAGDQLCPRCALALAGQAA